MQRMTSTAVISILLLAGCGPTEPEAKSERKQETAEEAEARSYTAAGAPADPTDDAGRWVSMREDWSKLYEGDEMANYLVTSDGARAYVQETAAADAQMVAYDGATGEVAWEIDWSYGQANPVVCEGTLVSTWSGDEQAHATGIDAESGKVLWEHELADSAMNTETQENGACFEGAYYVVEPRVGEDRRSRLTALDPETGVVVHQLDQADFHDDGLWTAAEWVGVADDRLVVGGRAGLYALGPDGRSRVWDLDVDLDPRKVHAFGDVVLLAASPASSDPWRALDAATGKELWSARLSGYVKGVADGLLITYDFDDDHAIIATDLLTGEERWRNDSRPENSMGREDTTVAAGTIVTCDRVVETYDPESGKSTVSGDFPLGCYGIVAAGGHLVGAWADGVRGLK